jgi:hypothetical protein
MSTTASTTITADVLRDAIAMRDADTLIGLYERDAILEIVDAGHPPSSPRQLQGAGAVAEHLRDVYARDMRHEVDTVSLTPDSLAYLVRCEYADGTRVVCSALATLRGGRIAREVVVQAWDS